MVTIVEFVSWKSTFTVLVPGEQESGSKVVVMIGFAKKVKTKEVLIHVSP